MKRAGSHQHNRRKLSVQERANRITPHPKCMVHDQNLCNNIRLFSITKLPVTTQSHYKKPYFTKCDLITHKQKNRSISLIHGYLEWEGNSVAVYTGIVGLRIWR